MLPQRSQAPQRAYKTLSRISCPLNASLLPPTNLPIRAHPNHVPVRHATHAAQGRANSQSHSAGRRLGAKKTGEQYVIPGNIIYRQRGTLWFPGENAGIGRDHSIFAKQAGYVKYYKNPRLHPKRKYIGVTFQRDDTLPTPPNAARRRRFGMVASPRPLVESKLDANESGRVNDIGIIDSPTGVGMAVAEPAVGSTPPPLTKAEKKRAASGRLDPMTLQMSSNYSFRETNWSIGRTAERAGVVPPKFKPGDRFAAWRKREKGKEKAKALKLVNKPSKKTKKDGKKRGRR